MREEVEIWTSSNAVHCLGEVGGCGSELCSLVPKSIPRQLATWARKKKAQTV